MSFTPQLMQYDSISTLLQYCSIQMGIIWYFVVFFLQMKKFYIVLVDLCWSYTLEVLPETRLWFQSLSTFKNTV